MIPHSSGSFRFSFCFIVLYSIILIVANFGKCDIETSYKREKRSDYDDYSSHEEWHIPPTDHCDQSLIPVLTNFDMKKFSGIWYELGKTMSGYINLYDAMWNITFSKTSSRFLYNGRNSEDECILPISGTVRVLDEIAGGLRLHYRTPTTLVNERVRILHTDYETFALIYTCSEIEENGSCHSAGIFASIWTRLPHVDVLIYNQAIEILYKNVCVEPRSVSITNRRGPCYDSTSTTKKIIPNQFPGVPSCTGVASCAIHCSPCCRKLHNCIVCDCENIILEEADKCYRTDECPLNCLYREKYRGCFTCECHDLPTKEFTPPGLCIEFKDHGHCDLDCANICEEWGNKGMTKFFFDPEGDECLPFEYTGCGGNKNNFESREHCQAVCQGIGISQTEGDGSSRVQSCIFTLLYVLLLSNLLP